MDADVGPVTAQGAPSWLPPWLAWLDCALHQEILRLRARHELAGDELRGLYISDAVVDDLVRRRMPSPEIRERLAGLAIERGWLLEEARVVPSPLHDLLRRFDVDAAGLVALVLCLAPEVELSYQTLYAYLNDDIARRLPTVDLCQRLAGASLRDDGGVVADGLVDTVAVDSAPVWASSGLVLPGPVRRFLLESGDSVGPVAPPGDRSLPRVLVVEAPVDQDALVEARCVVETAGRLLVIPQPQVEDPDRRLHEALLTARLRDAVVLLAGSDLGVGGAGARLSDVALVRWRTLLDSGVDLAVCLPPGVGDQLPLNGIDHERVVLAPLDLDARRERWCAELGERQVDVRADDLEAVASLFVLSAAQIRAAAVSLARRGDADLAALAQAARGHCTFGLATVAERVAPVYLWEDLVLPGATLHRLTDLAAAIRRRHQVFGAWSFGRLQGGHVSVRALFSGPSGTGKTMAAAVLARDLGLELYRVDLSTVVSKYVGETEENLERVLAAAENSNALLLFDEAEALFGKRSEVRDAHDRYANIEVAFLLQRIESYDGLLILATNLAGDLDEAFQRRIHFHIEFPLPDESARERLWRQAVPPSAPVDDDFDPEFLAGMFPMTGGEVRSASLMAAFMAADEGVPIGMTHLTRALARQRRQQGKLPSSAEFQGFLRLVQNEGG